MFGIFDHKDTVIALGYFWRFVIALSVPSDKRASSKPMITVSLLDLLILVPIPVIPSARRCPIPPNRFVGYPRTAWHYVPPTRIPLLRAIRPTGNCPRSFAYGRRMLPALHTH